MAISSLYSSFNGATPLLSSPLSHTSQRPHKFILVSCRATKLTEDKGSTNFYKVLSLDAHQVGIHEIKRAYRTMALQYHPDVCHPSRREESARIFVELHKAYKTLSDPISRKEYDFELGLSKFDSVHKGEARKGISRDGWEEQLCELRRKSDYRMTQEEGSWGNRSRAQRK